MSITVKELADSFFHKERANDRFGYWLSFLNQADDGATTEFFAGLLETVGKSLDDGDMGRVSDYIEGWHERGVAWFIDNWAIAKAVNATIPWAPLAKPLSQCRIALVTTGGLYKETDEPFGPVLGSAQEESRNYPAFMESHPSFRVIPRDYPRGKLRVSHPAYDHDAVLRDVNVLFPLDRFAELERDGVIGELAPESYSFMGLTNLKRLQEEMAPALAAEIKGKGVDAVFLTPA